MASLLGLLVVSLLCTINAHPTYPGGGPACNGASGGHGAAATGTDGGNTITVSTTTPTPGSPVTVTLSGNFRGFLLKVDGGAFTAKPSDAQDWTCTNHQAVAHNSRQCTFGSGYA